MIDRTGAGTGALLRMEMFVACVLGQSIGREIQGVGLLEDLCV